jgi:hypothetical protein
VLCLHGYLQDAEVCSSISVSVWQVLRSLSSASIETNKSAHQWRMQGFRKRIGSMRKALKARLEFVFVDAPSIAGSVDEAEALEGGQPGGRTWWKWTVHSPRFPSRLPS